jgi:hypothetical protein
LPQEQIAPLQGIRSQPYRLPACRCLSRCQSGLPSNRRLSGLWPSIRNAFLIFLIIFIPGRWCMKHCR